MRTLFLTISILAIAAAVMAPPASAARVTPGFQIEADGLLFSPMGELASQGGARSADLFANGGGMGGAATIGITPHLALGARIAGFQSEKEGVTWFDDMTSPDGVSLPSGSGPYRVTRQLKMLPLVGVAQFRNGRRDGFEWGLEAGAGIMSTEEHMRLLAGKTPLSSIVGYQKDPCWSAAFSLSHPYRRINVDVIGAGRWFGVLAGTGAAWVKDDNPGFMTWSLGLRYPHDTH